MKHFNINGCQCHWQVMWSVPHGRDSEYVCVLFGRKNYSTETIKEVKVKPPSFTKDETARMEELFDMLSADDKARKACRNALLESRWAAKAHLKCKELEEEYIAKYGEVK